MNLLSVLSAVLLIFSYSEQELQSSEEPIAVHATMAYQDDLDM